MKSLVRICTGYSSFPFKALVLRLKETPASSSEISKYGYLTVSTTISLCIEHRIGALTLISSFSSLTNQIVESCSLFLMTYVVS